MLLTRQYLQTYVNRLSDKGIEIILDTQTLKKLDTGVNINIYSGFELSGRLHEGHLIILFMLSKFSNFSNCKTYILFSQYHTRANLKEVDFSIYHQIRNMNMLHNCSLILSSSDGPNTLDNFMYSPEYVKQVQSLCTQSSVKRLIKSAAFFDRQQFINLKLSKFLYPLYQIADIQHLQIDVAIGGMDQRKIHMLHNDVATRACSYIHTPLIQDSAGKKISKSEKNNKLRFENLVQQFKLLGPEYKCILIEFYELIMQTEFHEIQFFKNLDSIQ